MNFFSLIGVVIGIFALAYFGSHPFRAKVDSNVRNHTQWTAQSIERNPSGYLEWAIGENSRQRQNLEAQKIRLSYEKSLAEKSLAFETKVLPLLQSRLSAAKAAYKDAEQQGAWPVGLNGESFDREELVSRILLLNSSVNSSRSKIETTQKTIEITTQSMPELENLKRELQQAESELSSTQLAEANARLFAGGAEIARRIDQIQSYSASIQKQSEHKNGNANVSAKVRGEVAQDRFQKILEE